MGVAERAVEPPWTCEHCGKGDNATRFHNGWTVTVSGERGYPEEPDVGEEGEYLNHEIELCDRCSRDPKAVLHVLAIALSVEALCPRCKDCGMPLEDGHCADCCEDCNTEGGACD